MIAHAPRRGCNHRLTVKARYRHPFTQRTLFRRLYGRYGVREFNWTGYAWFETMQAAAR
jgi:hypothetical protein